MVVHYLIYCSKYTNQRNGLKRNLKRGKRLDLTILGDKQNLPALFKYIKATNRFEDVYGDFTPAGATQNHQQP